MLSLRKFWSSLGPGLITGAADDDPSAIATYSIAGAKTGLATLWTMLYSLPLMYVLQDMAAKIGISSRCGLAGNLKRYYSRWLLGVIAVVILVTNIFNIGADVAGMAAAVELLVPRSSQVSAVLLILIVVLLTVVLPYRKVAAIFKWLSLSLVTYFLAVLLTVDHWPVLLWHSLVPTLHWSRQSGAILLAVFGTTLSPYLAVWQASEEAEEERLNHGVDGPTNRHLCRFRTVTKNELKHANADTAAGMVFSNLIGLFIMALTGTILFRAGAEGIETVRDAAAALQPLAGHYAYLLFTLGIVSAGLLAIPVLAGSAAYVLAEVFGWEASLDKPFDQAKQFYLVLIVATVLGLLMTYSGLSPIQALFYTAILQGLAGPLLIAVLLHMANNPAIVGPNRNSLAANLIGYLAFLAMSGVAVLFLFNR